ncbi:hypothetical protein NE237_027468 [Protea cynaroides]|uniref:Peptidase A1 domain-containing protein n=1 Tax=Protea cynaroides TaxID=273540 RepID=A0A9Q0GPE7_9MAGN|nr:hypothetical protein NE237_027468 [Protea cynaroides]
MVLNVRHKFAGQQPSLSAMKEHDSHRYRHHRLLYDIDLPLQGNGLENSTGLYYTQFGIGTPAKTYYVQVDTGSDVLWVNCAGCKNCPTTSSLGVNLQLYDPKASSTAKNITCQQEFCNVAYGMNANCASNMACYFQMEYGDGSATGGYYVSDVIQYNEVIGNSQTSPANTSIAFGCAVVSTGDLATSNGALDGILGMGPSSTSVVSQLASSGVVKDTFAHCLAGASGGGIFVIGEVVQPEVQTIPLLQNDQVVSFMFMVHYNVNLESVEVGGTVLQIPASAFSSSNLETIIDSGTTLAYLIDTIYQPMMNAILSQHPNLTNQLPCFQYTGRYDISVHYKACHIVGSLLSI